MRFNQTTDLTSPHSLKRSVLGVILAFICALFAAGCSTGGSGGGDFVAAPGGVAGGGGAPAAGTGSVTFNFVRAQNTITVPTNTVNLRFEFFTGLQGSGALVLNETQPFAATVTINNVPSSARSSVVTGLTTEGFPLTRFVVDIVVPAGGTITVDGLAGTSTAITLTSVSSSPATVNLGVGNNVQLVISAIFSNGDTVPLSGALAGQVNFVSNDLSVVTVAPDGTMTAGVSGTTTITATFNNPNFTSQVVTINIAVGNGITAPPTVTNLVLTTVEVQPVALPLGAASQPIVVTATFSDGSMRAVNAGNGVVFTSTNPGVSVDALSRLAVSGADASLIGTTQTVTATFQGATTTVQVSVVAANATAITAAPATIDLPFGGFEQVITVNATFSNGTNTALALTEVTFTGTGGANTGTNYTVNPANGTLTTAAAGAAGTETLTVTTVGNVGANIPAGLTTTVSVGVGNVTVTRLDVTPNVVPGAGLFFAPGQTQAFTVNAVLSNAATVDVSNFGTLAIAVQAGASAASVVVNGNQVVAVAATVPGPPAVPAVVTFDMPGSGAPQSQVNVTVVNEVIANFTDIEYQFGGIVIPANKVVNLPRGYVGVFEVIATFNTGVRRKLRASEYEIRAENQDDANFANDGLNGSNGRAIQLFNNNFAAQARAFPMLAQYFDGNAVDAAQAVIAGGSTNTADAEVDDVYFEPRTVMVIGGANTGSTVSGGIGGTAGTVVTRDTFRAIVADWRRGEDYLANSGGGLSVAATATTGADGNRVSPGSQRDFDIVLNSSVTGFTGGSGLDGNGFPNAPAEDGLSNVGVSVTVIDPLEVTFNSAGFVNYPTDPQVPLGGVREFEVRVNFSEITPADSISSTANPPAGGPTVAAITGWKLAEANVSIASQIGGSANTFIEHTPTEIGLIGITSATEVDVNTVFVRAQPLLGDNARQAAVVPPSLDAAVPPNYTPGTYEEILNIFGAASLFTTTEFQAQVEARDPGPAPNNGQTTESRATSAPPDVYVRTVTVVPNTSIDIVDPVLFSLDPINPAGQATALVLNVGGGQNFRTLVQYEFGQPVVDRSLDFPPTAFFGTTAAGSARGVAATGNVQVSGINAAGNDVGAGVMPPLAAAQPHEIVVVALDTVGNVITQKGAFAGSLTDQNGAVGPAQSFTTLDVNP